MLGCLASFQAQGQSSADETFNILATGTGVELGIGAYHNEYQEHTATNPDFMHQSGKLYDLHLDGHLTLDNNVFLKANVRIGDAHFDYSGSGNSGTQTAVKDRLYDIRFLAGKDFFPRPSVAISPYIGLGSRNLFDDGRGPTSTGAIGYRRESQYLYLPVGTSLRFGAGKDARINTTLEYNHFLRGWQKTYLSDVVSGAPDIVNRQTKGYGLRASIAYEKGNWSIGPVFEQWKVNISEYVYLGAVRFDEPSNKTSEYGLRTAYRF